jgi:hypothetical protein
MCVALLALVAVLLAAPARAARGGGLRQDVGAALGAAAGAVGNAVAGAANTAGRFAPDSSALART